MTQGLPSSRSCPASGRPPTAHSPGGRAGAAFRASRSAVLACSPSRSTAPATTTSAIASPPTALSKAVGTSTGQPMTCVACAAIGEFQMSVMRTMIGALRRRARRELQHVALIAPEIEHHQHVAALHVEQVVGPARAAFLYQPHAGPQLAQAMMEIGRQHLREAAAEAEDLAPLVAHQLGDGGIFFGRHAPDRTLDIAAQRRANPFLHLAALAPAAQRRISRQRALQPLLHLAPQAVLELGVALEAEAADEPQDRGPAGAGPLREARDRLQSRDRVVAQQRLGDAALRRRVVPEVAPDPLRQRLIQSARVHVLRYSPSALHVLRTPDRSTT